MSTHTVHLHFATTRPHYETLAEAEHLRSALAPLGLLERLNQVRETIPGRVVLTSSFGIEDQAITHAIFENEIDIEIITLDTGRLFPETYSVWAETEQRYGRRIRSISPNHERVEGFVAREGIDGFRNSIDARQACCHIRKVEPLARALESAAGWITGLRGDQSDSRADLPYAAMDTAHRLIKVNPLIDWSRARVVDYIAANHIPYNALHDRGFLSIGCAPCTRAVTLGESERAGRWWWEQESQKECGLHASPIKPAPRAKVRELAEQDG